MINNSRKNNFFLRILLNIVYTTILCKLRTYIHRKDKQIKCFNFTRDDEREEYHDAREKRFV